MEQVTPKELTPDRVPGDCEPPLFPKPRGGEAVTEMPAPGLIRTPACTGPTGAPTRVRMEARSGKGLRVKSSIEGEDGRQGGGKKAITKSP